MKGLRFPTDDKVLVGLATGDDAGVYKISDDLALIQTVDFFTPIVDDPYDFGRIAAANALSDVYAMGGAPKTAMNIVAYPMEKLGKASLRAMLEGSCDTVRKAGAVLLGGHSVEDEELKYGLSVTGFVHPGRIRANQGLAVGDHLILTKPLGTGIVNTAIKAGLASLEATREVTELMATLNRDASEVMSRFSVSACTDITGFGFLGHLAEMIAGTAAGVVIESTQVPVIKEAVEFGSMGFVPVGAHKNRAYREGMTLLPEGFDPVLRDILFDPQTSGGLLIGCPEKEAKEMVVAMQDSGIDAAVVGHVVEDVKNMMQLK